jgi:hypothetical protein
MLPVFCEAYVETISQRLPGAAWLACSTFNRCTDLSQASVAPDAIDARRSKVPGTRTARSVVGPERTEYCSYINSEMIKEP